MVDVESTYTCLFADAVSTQYKEFVRRFWDVDKINIVFCVALQSFRIPGRSFKVDSTL